MFVVLKAEDAFERSNWLAAFKTPFQPTAEERPDQHGNPLLLLSADEFEGITDQKALVDIAKVRVRELNSIIGAMSGASNVTVEGVAEIVDGVVCCHVFLEAELAKFEAKFGWAQIAIVGADGTPKPPPPSPAQEQYRAARLNELVAQALAYTVGKPDFFDLFKALECLEAGGFVKKGNRVTERFSHTANAIFRHRLGKYELPNKPMTIEESRAHIRSLIDQAIATVLAMNPL